MLVLENVVRIVALTVVDVNILVIVENVKLTALVVVTVVV